MARDIVTTFNLPDYSAPITMATTEPVFDPEDLLGIIPADDQQHMDMYKV